MMYPVLTHRSGRHQISMTARASRLIWPFRMSSAMHSAVLHGSHCITAAGLDGERGSTGALGWFSTAHRQPEDESDQCSSGMSITVLQDAAGQGTAVLSHQ